MTKTKGLYGAAKAAPFQNRLNQSFSAACEGVLHPRFAFSSGLIKVKGGSRPALWFGYVLAGG
jgi:hypothetical protein